MPSPNEAPTQLGVVKVIYFRTINNASNISTTFLAHVDGQRNMRTLPLPNRGSKGMCSIRRRKAPASAPGVTPATRC